MTMNYGKMVVFCMIICSCGICLIHWPARAAADDTINSAYWTTLKNNIKPEQITLTPNQKVVIRLKVELPAGKTLKAYSLAVLYDQKIMSVEDVTPSADAPLPPVNIAADKPGVVSINAFDVSGVEAGKTGKTISLIDIKLKGMASGSSFLRVVFSNFGASSEDEFKPEILPVKVTVQG